VGRPEEGPPAPRRGPGPGPWPPRRCHLYGGPVWGKGGPPPRAPRHPPDATPRCGGAIARSAPAQVFTPLIPNARHRNRPVGRSPRWLGDGPPTPRRSGVDLPHPSDSRSRTSPNRPRGPSLSPHHCLHPLAVEGEERSPPFVARAGGTARACSPTPCPPLGHLGAKVGRGPFPPTSAGGRRAGCPRRRCWATLRQAPQAVGHGRLRPRGLGRGPEGGGPRPGVLRVRLRHRETRRPMGGRGGRRVWGSGSGG